MDRAHRIGQKKVVNVYRLISRGTLEEKIMGLVILTRRPVFACLKPNIFTVLGLGQPNTVQFRYVFLQLSSQCNLVVTIELE